MHHKPVRTFSVKVLLCTLVFLVLVQGVLAAGASVGESHAAPLNPEFIRYMEERTNTSSVQADSPHLSLMSSSLSEATDSSIFPVGSRSLGSIPSPIYHPELSDVQMSVSPAGYRTSGYPASFDLRTCGKVSPVKDQTYFGTCWAFASLASLESTLMPAATLDFSEKNLANLAGFDGDIPNGGGNMLMSTAYLTRWNGPVNETTDPYPADSTWTPSSTYPAVQHVQNVVFIPSRTNRADTSAIKDALTQWGAVHSSLFWNNSFYNATYTSYLHPATALNGYPGGGHAVTIVGWDDTYAAGNFTTPADGPGAWLVKNSWGPGWGAGGFFYVSYYDKYFGSIRQGDGTYKDTAVYRADSTSRYDTIYSYERLGLVNSYFAAEPKTGTFANVFTANSSETLQAVGFYTSDLNVPYTISIYKNPTSGPVGGIPAATFSGTLPTMGYNTVVIPVLQQVPVMPGDRFSVVVQVTNPTDNYPIPVEENYPGYIHGIVSQPGQGYAINSSGWTDWKAIVNDSHLCLKAYTSPTPPAAGFTGAPLSGTTPLTVTFTDTSTCIPTSWNWSFGDGTFSTARNPSHTYTATGSYTVSLNATNATPASYYLTRTGYITVNAAPVELNPSGGSDNTPPPLEQGIPGTQTVNVGGMTTVSRVTVPGTDIGDLIVTSSEVSGPGNGVSPPPGIVEEYLEIIASRYSTITGAEIEFSVPQSWLDANHFNPQDIVMMHHAGSGWVALPTTFVRSKDGRVYFTATSPGFSRFAIIGQAASVVQSPAVTPSPTVQISGAITPASVPLATPSTSATSIVPVARNTVAVGTTVPPASVSPPAHGFPLTTIALVGAGCIVLIGSGFLVRRWWIRRQNPALFREYD